MTHDDLKAWREAMHYTQHQAADALGVQPKNYQQLERGTSYATGKPITIDLRTALACAAIAAGIKPWGSPPAAPPQ